MADAEVKVGMAVHVYLEEKMAQHGQNEGGQRREREGVQGVNDVQRRSLL